jgi:hypothetical protein
MIKIIFRGYVDKSGRRYPPDRLPEAVTKTIMSGLMKDRTILKSASPKHRPID